MIAVGIVLGGCASQAPGSYWRPPSLRLAPPSHYRTYVAPRKEQERKPPTAQPVQPPPPSIYPLQDGEADRRIEAVQRDIAEALKQIKQGEKR